MDRDDRKEIVQPLRDAEDNIGFEDAETFPSLISKRATKSALKLMSNTGGDDEVVPLLLLALVNEIRDLNDTVYKLLHEIRER